jgi:hypothetical protein
MFHVQLGSGPQNVILRNEGQSFVSQTGNPTEAVRPIKPNHRPVFRPGTPCELQQTPDLHAAGGSPDTTVTSTGVPVPIPPLPFPAAAAKSISAPTGAAGKPFTPEQKKLVAEVESYLALQHAGVAVPSPFQYKPKDYLKVLAKAGFTLAPDGKIVAKPGAKQAARSTR